MFGHRPFKGKWYPVPGIDTARTKLRPRCRWQITDGEITIFEDDLGRECPTMDDLIREVGREEIIHKYFEYERKRYDAYPTWREQMDMLYHDIKSGNLNNGEWITAIDAVKEEHPKPNYPEPDGSFC